MITTTLKDGWGVEVVENGIEILAVTPPADYQEALAAPKKAEKLADARRVQTRIEAEARASEIVGTVISAVVSATGMTTQKVQEECEKDPAAFYEKHKVIVDNTMTKLSIEKGLYFRMETPGADGALGDFLRLILAGRIPLGGGGKGGGGAGAGQPGEGKGDKTIKLPDGTARTLSKEERERRGLSY